MRWRACKCLCDRVASFRRPGRDARRGGAWRSVWAACRNGSPASSSRAIVSPCAPIRTGKRFRRRLAAYSRQFAVSSHTRKPKTPGMLQIVVPLTRSTPGRHPCQLRLQQSWQTAYTTASRSLWPTVTTGKCLIGLICGSIQHVDAEAQHVGHEEPQQSRARPWPPASRRSRRCGSGAIRRRAYISRSMVSRIP